MNNPVNLKRALGILLAVNMETAFLLVSAWLVGSWLNENYPIQVSWYRITFIFVSIAISITWVRMIKAMLKK